MHQNVIIQSLKQERVIKNDNDVQFSHIATPQFMGCDAWAYAVDLDNLNIQLKNLHKTDVLARISANLGGIKVGYANTQGFAFIIKNERVASLEPIDLLDVCQEPDEDGRLHDLWVYGQKGAGKTSLFQHIARSDIEFGRRVFVADPKPSVENDWSGASAYGNGYDWDSVDACIWQMKSALDRYGKTGVEVPHTFILDEWWNIKRHIRDAPERVFDIVTIARTAGIRTIIGTHSDTVVGSGIEGQGDLKLNFNVKVTLSKNGNRRVASVDNGYGDAPALHPGPFISGQIIDATSQEQLTDTERYLIRFACRHNNGSFAVSSLHGEIKKRLPVSDWSTGGKFTYHKLRTMLEDFESRGLLSSHGNKRQPTDKIWFLLGRG